MSILGLVLRHPQTPWYAKVWIGVVIGYTMSPIDLIPDFIPVLGYLDDLVFVPLGVWIAIRLIPKKIWLECEQKIQENEDQEKV